MPFTILGRSLMICWRKKSWNPERVSFVFTFVSVCLCVCLSVCSWATEHTCFVLTFVPGSVRCSSALCLSSFQTFLSLLLFVAVFFCFNWVFFLWRLKYWYVTRKQIWNNFLTSFVNSCSFSKSLALVCFNVSNSFCLASLSVSYLSIQTSSFFSRSCERIVWKI